MMHGFFPRDFEPSYPSLPNFFSHLYGVISNSDATTSQLHLPELHCQQTCLEGISRPVARNIYYADQVKTTLLGTGSVVLLALHSIYTLIRRQLPLRGGQAATTESAGRAVGRGRTERTPLLEHP